MPTLNIEGHQVQVDDSFMSLSPDQQNATVDEIAKSLQGGAQPQGQPQGNPVAEASARAQAGIAHAQQVMAQGGPHADPQTMQPPGVPTYQPPGVHDSYDPKTGDYTNYGTDAARSAASGVRQGIETGIGGFGDVGGYQNSIAQWAAGKMGASPETQATVGNVAGHLNPFFMAPNTADLQASTNAVIGKPYEPKTVPGEYASTIGQFAPMAVLPNGEASLPMRLLTQSVIPGMSSEAAGQATKGTALEPYARMAGAVAGGVAGNSLAKPASQTAALPTAAEIKTSAGYSDLKAPMKAATITKDTYNSIVSDLWNEANDFGLTTQLKGEVQGTLKDFAVRAKTTGTPSLYDLEVLRRSLRNIGGNPLDKSAQALSSKLIANLDNNVENLSAASIAATGETGKPVLDVLKEARGTYKIGVKSQLIENAIENAKNAASGNENGLRIEFRKLLKPGMVENFTDGERKMIEQVARGNLKSNALRWFGSFGIPTDSGRNFLGSVIGGSVGSTIGGMAAGPAGMLVGGPLLAGAGTLAKMASNAATQNSAALVEELVKAGPAGNQLLAEAMKQASEAGKQALMRAALQAKTAAQVPMSQSRAAQPAH